MTIGDKIKVKEEFREIISKMPEFSKISLDKTMTVTDFESVYVLVKENEKKWRVNWLELAQNQRSIDQRSIDRKSIDRKSIEGG